MNTLDSSILQCLFDLVQINNELKWHLILDHTIGVLGGGIQEARKNYLPGTNVKEVNSESHVPLPKFGP